MFVSDVGDVLLFKCGVLCGGLFILLLLFEWCLGVFRVMLWYVCVDGKLCVMWLNEYDDVECGNGG